MILGAVYLVAEAWSIGRAALVPIGIVAIVGWSEYRHVRKVTLIEHSASHVVWRIDYRTKDPSKNR